MPTDPIKPNEMTLVPRAVYDSQAQWGQTTSPIPAGVLAFDSTTKELKVCNGTHNFLNTESHCHPFQYSPLGHSHYFGYDQKWFRVNPRLWLTADLVNHTELIPCSGQIVTGDVANSLSEIYTGSVQISPTLLANTTDILTVSASSEYSESYAAYKLFGPELTTENYFLTNDQWVATAEDTAWTITGIYTGNPTYRITSYHLYTRLGQNDTPFKLGPTPRSWELLGTTDGGTSWISLATVTDAEPWNLGSGREYPVDNVTAVNGFQLHITAWYPGDDPTLNPGLKRFFVFGRQTDIFNMPNIPSPHPDFTFVVPYTDLGIGMKHEEVGDIVYTITPQPLTMPNRILLDGRTVKRSLEPDLFAVVGYDQDQINDLVGVIPTVAEPHTTSIVDQSIHLDSEATDGSEVILSFTSLSGKISQYYLAPKTGGAQPVHWTLEVYDGTNWTVLHDHTFDSETDSYGWWPVTDYEAVVEQSYRLTILTWSEGVLGVDPIQFKTHPTDYFYLADLVVTDDSKLPYIVSKVRVEDVNDDIVARLQNNVAAIADLLVSAQARITALEAAQG